MRALAIFIALLLPSMLWAQSDEVLPGELSLSVTVETTGATPLTQEMVLIRIRGEYRRHITLENLQQPDLDGFNWAQLGPDVWTEERIDGKKVKIFNRRMALYPKRSGRLTIGSFSHRLTLTNHLDKWFEHDVMSEPIVIEVDPAPVSETWWFPVSNLKISDEWSNPPDQLSADGGVLRVIRLEALGATPDMIPPMPELTSPTGMIFAHPEKRLVELTPDGPVTYAFWRWTIRPTNGVSGIIEPIRVHYFDTKRREAQEVVISAQRVAYVANDPPAKEPLSGQETQALMPVWAGIPLVVLVFLTGLFSGLSGRVFVRDAPSTRFAVFDPVTYRLIWSVLRHDSAKARRAASTLLARDRKNLALQDAISEFDSSVFQKVQYPVSLVGFATKVLRRRRIRP